jgi:predicted AAA+ superfamily ATPase
MVRLLLQALVRWTEQAHRKPVLIDGARQIGKTYLVENLFQSTSAKC